MADPPDKQTNKKNCIIVNKVKCDEIKSKVRQFFYVLRESLQDIGISAFSVI